MPNRLKNNKLQNKNIKNFQKFLDGKNNNLKDKNNTLINKSLNQNLKNIFKDKNQHLLFKIFKIVLDKKRFYRKRKKEMQVKVMIKIILINQEENQQSP